MGFLARYKNSKLLHWLTDDGNSATPLCRTSTQINDFISPTVTRCRARILTDFLSPSRISSVYGNPQSAAAIPPTDQYKHPTTFQTILALLFGFNWPFPAQYNCTLDKMEL